MSFEQVKYEFLNFTATHSAHIAAAEVAERLHARAPSGSCLKLTVKPGHNLIYVSCKIVSCTQTFFASTTAESILSALSQLERKLTDQLNHWKDSRFLTPA